MVPTTPKNVLFCPYSPTHPLSKLWKNQVNLHWLVSPTHAARFPGLHIKSSGHLFSFTSRGTYSSPVQPFKQFLTSCTKITTGSVTFHHFSCNHSSTKAVIRCSEHRRLGKMELTWENDQNFESKPLENVLLCVFPAR